MDLQNLAYSIAQIFHNLGAVAIVGGSAAAIVIPEPILQRRIALSVLAGWLVQAFSGASFGAISYYYYAAFPDLAGVAKVALIVKIVCVSFGIVLAIWQVSTGAVAGISCKTWSVTCGLGVLALSSAAVLRWFS